MMPHYFAALSLGARAVIGQISISRRHPPAAVWVSALGPAMLRWHLARTSFRSAGMNV
jgi:hypothetical protein